MGENNIFLNYRVILIYTSHTLKYIKNFKKNMVDMYGQ